MTERDQNHIPLALERIQQVHPVIQKAKRGLPHPGHRPGVGAAHWNEGV